MMLCKCDECRRRHLMLYEEMSREMNMPKANKNSSRNNDIP